MTNGMRGTTIAIVGTGAVGGYYGSKLHAAAAAIAGRNNKNNKVLFHMRGSNFHVAQQQGLFVQSITGDVHIPPSELNAYQSTHEMAAAVAGSGGFDWVIVALKSTAMDEIPDLVAPLLSSQKTRLLVIMNGLVEDALIQRLKRRKCRYRCLYGGMAFLCAERTAPAVIEHKRYGSLTAALAEEFYVSSHCDVDDHEAILHDLFLGTGVTISYESSLLRGRWKKMMVNLSFNGLCVAAGGVTVDQIVAHPRLRALASTIMDEASAIANAELVERYGVDQFQPLGAAEKAAMMEWCDGVGEFAPSTLVDFMNGHQMELRYLFQEPILRGRRLAIPCPVLQAVVTQIEILAKTPRQRPTPPCFAKQHQHYGAATSLVDRIPLKSVGQNVLQTTPAVALLLLHTS